MRGSTPPTPLTFAYAGANKTASAVAMNDIITTTTDDGVMAWKGVQGDELAGGRAEEDEHLGGTRNRN